MRRLVRFVLALLLLCAVGAAAGAYALSRVLDSAAVKLQIESLVAEETGATCRIDGEVAVSLLPRLGLSIEDLVLFEPDTDNELLRIGRLHASVRIWALFSRTLEFDRILLAEPSLFLRVDSDGSMPWEDILRLRRAASTQTAVSPLPAGFSLRRMTATGFDIRNGVVEWQQAVQVPAATPSLVSAPDVVRFSRVTLSVDADDVPRWSGSLLLESSFAEANASITANGEMLFDRASLSPRMVNGTVDVAGGFQVDGRVIPVTLKSLFQFAPGTPDVAFPDVTADVDGVGVSAALLLTGADSAEWALKGAARVRKLSLPYWFEFGENLPQSLQHALDALDGSCSVTLTRKGVWAEGLQVQLLGMRFSGEAGVADFSRPVVYVDVSGPFADVNAVFPEIRETPPKRLPAPSRPGLAVLRSSGEDGPSGSVWDKGLPSGRAAFGSNAEFPLVPPENVPGEEGAVGYDIRVRADKAVARSFSMENFAFRCWPMPQTGTYTSYRVGSFYGGSVNALLSIRQDLGLDVSVERVKAGEPSKLITGEAILGGEITGAAAVRGNAHTVWGLVAGLEGSVRATLRDGYVQSLALRSGEKPRFSLAECALALDGKSTHPAPDKAERYWPYDWNLRVDYVPSSAGAASSKTAGSAKTTGGGVPGRYSVQLRGPVVVDTKRALPVRATKAAGSLRWIGTGAPMGAPVPLDVTLTGQVDIDLDKETLSVARGSVTAPELSATCAFQVSSLLGAPQWEGSVKIATVNPRAVLSRYGAPLWTMSDPRALTSGQLFAGFRLADETLFLRDLRLGVDGTQLSGTAKFGGRVVPAYEFSLHGDRVDADRYLPPAVADNATVSADRNGTSSQEAPSTAWKLDWLRETSIAGNARFDHVIYRNMEFSDIAATLAVANGRLRLAPFSAVWYGGEASGELAARVISVPETSVTGAGVPAAQATGPERTDGLDTRVNFSVKNLNLESVAMRLAGQQYVGGTASLYGDLRGIVRGGDDIPGAMGGIWGFEIQRGFYSTSTRADGTRSRTPFSHSSADGQMDRGVLTSDNFSLQSTLVSMAGGGKVDLVRREMDTAINVTYAEVPTFPVRIYGKIADPQFSVRGAQIIPRTIEKLGGGVFNLFKRVITSPFRALEMLGNIGSNSTQTP